MLARQISRLRRVAVGLLRPSSRPAYLARIRARGRREAPYARVPRRADGDSSACRICLFSPVEVVDVEERKRPQRVLTFEICPSCGHVANPDNTFDYRGYRSADEMTPGPRIGTEERPGREFHMAQMAAEILGRTGLHVLVFGAGRSLDNHHIERLDPVASVTIADIMQVRDDAPFVQADQAAPRRYPVVVASEVVEHFLDPRADMPHLFSFVEDDGLLVCSTNIMDGTDVTSLRYPFYRGHVSLYSPRSFGILAREHGYLVDFRLPLVATGFAGRQKRYVLLTRSTTVMARTAEYFGRHAFAPSDAAHPGKRG
jgi:Methyltransferase domain